MRRDGNAKLYQESPAATPYRKNRGRLYITTADPSSMFWFADIHTPWLRGLNPSGKVLRSARAGNLDNRIEPTAAPRAGDAVSGGRAVWHGQAEPHGHGVRLAGERGVWQ